MVATTVGGGVGTVVATGVVFPLPVQPAASASMTTAARLKVINKYDLFMVFYHLFTQENIPFFAINYTSIYI
jgi:hypothetical protein